MSVEASALLQRMVELTELEARLITQADVDGMSRVFDERATLIAALPDIAMADGVPTAAYDKAYPAAVAANPSSVHLANRLVRIPHANAVLTADSRLIDRANPNGKAKTMLQTLPIRM